MFVAAGLVLFVAAIFYIGKQKHLFNPVFRLNSMFKNINGLEVGNNVRFSGINVGTVDNIQIINDTTVQVSVIIDKDIQQFVKTDCHMAIGSEGLIGDKIINITQGNGSAETIREGQFLVSNPPLETDGILASLKVTGENAEVVSGQLAQILYKINSGKGTFGMLINDSNMATNINTTINNLKRSTKGLDENMEAAKHNILLRGYFNKKKKEQTKANDKEANKDSGKTEEKPGLIKKLFNKKKPAETEK